MGSTFTGGTQKLQDQQLLTPQQQQIFGQTITSAGPQFNESLQNALTPMGQEEKQALFQQTYVEPALQALNQQILPSIQQRFADMGASSSSALNQALAQAAGQVATNIGSQYGGFQQNQNAQLQDALRIFAPFLTQQTFQPVYQQSPGILGSAIGAAGQIGAGYFGGRR